MSEPHLRTSTCPLSRAKYLSVSKKGTTITLIPDLENVAEDDVPDNSITIYSTKVLAATLNAYSTCIACKSKVKLRHNVLHKMPNESTEIFNINRSKCNSFYQY